MSPYLDGAALADMKRLAGRWEGLTTNPSLMKKAGVSDYRSFARAVLDVAGGLPVSFEVLASEGDELIRQGREIAGWGPNVYVKVPVVTSTGAFQGEAIERLSATGARLNVTAIMTPLQVDLALVRLKGSGHILSVFAGRVADAGVDPEPLMREAAHMVAGRHSLLWASAREVFNIKQAERCGADVITLSPNLFAKMEGFGRDLATRSVETVREFQRDAEGIAL